MSLTLLLFHLYAVFALFILDRVVKVSYGDSKGNRNRVCHLHPPLLFLSCCCLPSWESPELPRGIPSCQPVFFPFSVPASSSSSTHLSLYHVYTLWVLHWMRIDSSEEIYFWLPVFLLAWLSIYLLVHHNHSLSLSLPGWWRLFDCVCFGERKKHLSIYSCFSFPLLPSYHLYSLWVQRLYEDSSAGGHTLDQLVQRRTFDLLSLQVCNAVQEIKQHAALLQLLAEKVV